ncbi:UDP-glycosyltransferase 91C1-like [Prunus yedoensis var. nudiflora]|uniref:UDP-glycosyltransferase 91C1-like n=1 Tax=Prunus yedoensis var. nudiflora TaxID=2094558 RepID=A0A314UU95_PRUYE|nr:UDP-glycosyltransferase 91C1-like [Prunus yedoensis var. nudiflora]
MDNKDNHKLHITMFPWLAYGHIMPFLEVSKFLAQKGHRVSFISTPKNIQRLPKSSLSPLITFVELPLPAIEGLPHTTESTSELPIHKVPYLKKAYDLLQPPLTHFLQHSDVNWVIHDFVCHWLPESRLSTESTRFTSTSPMPLHWLSVALLLSYAEVNASGRRTSRLCRNGLTFLQMLLLSSMRWFADAIQYCNLVTMRSSTEFEPDSVSLLSKLYGKPVIPLGLLPPSSVTRQHGGADDQVDENWEVLREWLDNKKERSVIYIALGTEVTLTQELMHELAHGIEKSGLPFIWVINNRPLVEGMLGADIIPPGFETRVDNRGLVWRGWAPQLKVLGHSSIGGFLTHCGWSSVIEALGFGRVLILFSGANADQGLIARLLHGKQVGLEIPRDERDGSFTSDSVAELTRRVMVDKEGESLRSNAWAMKEIFGNKELNNKCLDEFTRFLETWPAAT